MKDKQTPLMRQYWDIKSAHNDKVLMFRMGDFFEMFFDDAKLVAPVLGIALTSRNKKSGDETPMCGVPHHSVAGPINKLLANGFKVAICDQIEDPKVAKGIVKRAVTRVLSPGMVFDPETLDQLDANYLCSYEENSISFLEPTTGEAFYFTKVASSDRNRLVRVLQPRELVLDVRFIDEARKRWPSIHLTSFTEEMNNDSEDLPKCARRLKTYACKMQGDQVLKTIRPFAAKDVLQGLELSQTSIRHLELFKTYQGENKGSLFHALNRCKTAAGARLLKSFLSFPLLSRERISQRQKHIQYWFDRPDQLKELRQTLAGLGDVERRLGKISNPSCGPRDLESLADSLRIGLKVTSLANSIKRDQKKINQAAALMATIDHALIEEAPVSTQKGHFIRKGYRPELDDLISYADEGQEKLSKLESRERTLTGISSLRIRYNKVFGYYIEVTNTHKSRVPLDRYQRRQTLANAERYVTSELQQLEEKILSAKSRRQEMELEVFADLKDQALKIADVLLELAQMWSHVDVFSAVAWLAIENNYCRPEFSQEQDLKLFASRHPVVEQEVEKEFVPNDIEIRNGQCLMLTGPNMAGKSTIMRQVAVTAIMAQAGMFVPAQKAELPLYDRIFTRVGASDSLAEGLSTFMVEMQETAEILCEITSRSLVILDEVGRGTSTYDGMSLAQAILEHLLQKTGAMTLFATHYHELSQLDRQFPQMINVHMSIREQDQEIIFLHTLVPGPANRSYGIQVAQLAGLPKSVTRRAQTILNQVEMGKDPAQLSLADLVAQPQESEDDDISKGLLADIKSAPVQKMTPLEALNQIAQWQQELS